MSIVAITESSTDILDGNICTDAQYINALADPTTSPMNGRYLLDPAISISVNGVFTGMGMRVKNIREKRRLYSSLFSISIGGCELRGCVGVEKLKTIGFGRISKRCLFQ